MKIKQHIPNLLTLGNLFCGCVAIVYAFQGNLVVTAYLVFIAAVLDFLDGFVARALNAYSDIGKQLDSLADVVTFGVVPGVVMFQILNFSFVVFDVTRSVSPDQNIIGAEALAKFQLPLFPFGNAAASPGNGIPFIAFLITVFSALRLAKFNTDVKQTDSFTGLPTPANAIFICSIPFVAEALFGTVSAGMHPPLAALQHLLNAPVISDLELFLVNPIFLCGLTLLMSFLLVSEISLFAFKFKSYSWQENKIRYVFLIVAAALLIVFQFPGIPFIVFLYVVLSVINNIIIKKKHHEIQS